MLCLLSPVTHLLDAGSSPYVACVAGTYSNMPLPQQLEHASKQSGFSDDKQRAAAAASRPGVSLPAASALHCRCYVAFMSSRFKHQTQPDCSYQFAIDVGVLM